MVVEMAAPCSEPLALDVAVPVRLLAVNICQMSLPNFFPPFSIIHCVNKGHCGHKNLEKTSQYI